MQRRILSRISPSTKLNFRFTQNLSSNETPSLNLNGGGDDPPYSDVPKPRRDKSERKPYPTPMKILIRRAKEQRESRKAEPVKLLEHPPGNGLLVPELVTVAHQVYRARQSLLSGLYKLVQFIPVQRCSLGSVLRLTLAVWVMKSEPALARKAAFEVLHMYGEREELVMLYSFPSASISMIVLGKQELCMTRGILFRGFLPLLSSVFKLV